MAETLLTIKEFQENPELSAQFGGDYTKYKAAFIKNLMISDVFNFASMYASINRLNNSDVSIFGGLKTSQTKRFELLELVELGAIQHMLLLRWVLR